MHALSQAHRKEAPINAHEGPNVSRTFDAKNNMWAVRVLPGAYYVTDARDEMIVTVLGSCVAACVRDPNTGFGGLNHFMLPNNETADWNGINAALRYGNFAMEALINEVLKSGCRREDLEIKLFGGANLNVGPTLIGTKNSEFAVQYLAQEGLRLTAHDLGGARGRRIHYFPETGAVKRLLQKPTAERNFVRQEQEYVSTLRIEPVEGDIELFG
ncbi:chemoreceptor glutamine deamidase CheD [Roseibium sp.]|uniref:chemoreceptor glutamine deamidase CheD n=1 Tax=Roseibium sp. TaxID=1936156 RepID=UPI003A97D895